MKKLLLITFAFSLIAYCTSGKGRDLETRTATVQMKVSPNDLINIQAKYTDLVVETWDKNEVEIIATVRFDGKMTDKMVSFLDNFQEHVKENIQSMGGELRIDTNLDEPNKIQIGSKHVGIIIGFSDEELRLDYKVKAPKVNEYEINSSYRDVFLTGNFGKMKFTQYSGDLNADYIEEADLNMKYGNSSFKGIRTATMEIYEQELDAHIIGELKIDAKYSEVEIDQIDRMKATSYETDYTFGNVGYISGNFKYGEMEIENKVDKSEFEFYEMELEANEAGQIEFILSKYGEMKFDRVNSLSFLQSYEDELFIGTLGSFESTNSKYGKHEIQNLTKSFVLDAYEDDVEIDEVESTAEKISIKGKYINTSLGIENQSFNLKSDVKYGKIAYEESDVEVKRYIKDGDVLEVEILSKNKNETPISIAVEGYEIDVEIN